MSQNVYGLLNFINRGAEKSKEILPFDAVWPEAFPDFILDLKSFLFWTPSLWSFFLRAQKRFIKFIPGTRNFLQFPFPVIGLNMVGLFPLEQWRSWFFEGCGQGWWREEPRTVEWRHLSKETKRVVKTFPSTVRVGALVEALMSYQRNWYIVKSNAIAGMEQGRGLVRAGTCKHSVTLETASLWIWLQEVDQINGI